MRRSARTHNVTFFSILRETEREREILVIPKTWRHTRLRARFAKFLTRSQKGKAEIAARERRLGGQKCCVVVSDEITGRQIRGPLSTVNLSPRYACKNALCRRCESVSTNRRRCIDRCAGQVPLSSAC